MSNPTDTELLIESCKQASSFPKNIVRQSTPIYHLESHFTRLYQQAPRLFCEDGKAALDIWEYDDNVKEFQPTHASNVFELVGRLEGARRFSHVDPRCRYLFIQALHSRAHLRISKEMLVAAFTHHQVMPAFLDFIFPFGMQENPQDFLFSGLHEDTMLQSPPRGLVVPNLGRSGREIRMCYNLKSVETSLSNIEWPWAIRQTAVYHSFDVATGKSFWVMVKGNERIRNRIKATTIGGSTGPTDLKSFSSTGPAFTSTLATHLVLCDWCDEEWRWYLNYLENRLQDANRRALAIIIDNEPSLYEEPVHPEFKSPSSSSIFRSLTKKIKRPFSTTSRQIKSSTGLEKQKIHAPFAFPPLPSAPTDPPGPPPPPTVPPGMPGAMPNDKRTTGDEAFTFKNLQLVQYFEEKANEVAPVLEANIDTLTELKEHYQSAFKSDDFPDELKSSCNSEIAQFEKRINWIITDLQRQKSRTMILKTRLGESKALLHGILNKQAIETNKILIKKVQISAEKMELVVEVMNLNARQDTISRKITSLVTLFFLPGIFTSVLMSTDIIHFQENKRNFQIGALQTYLAITISFMALAFGAWYMLYMVAARKDPPRNYKTGGADFFV